MRTVPFHHLFLAAGSVLALMIAAPTPQEGFAPELARAVAAGAAEPSPTGLPAVNYLTLPFPGDDVNEATRIVGQVMNYTDAHYSELASVRAFRSSVGDDWTYHLFFEHPTLMDFRRTMAGAEQDEGWGALWRELNRTFPARRNRLMFPVGGSPGPEGPRRLHRRTRSSFAKLPRAYLLARELAEHMGATYGVRVTLYADQAGDPGALHWFEEYDQAIHMKAVRSKLLEDERYIELFDRAEDLFLEDDYSEELLYEIL